MIFNRRPFLGIFQPRWRFSRSKCVCFGAAISSDDHLCGETRHFVDESLSAIGWSKKNPEDPSESPAHGSRNRSADLLSTRWAR